MDKKIILQQIKDLIQEGDVTKKEVLNIYHQLSEGETPALTLNQRRLTNVLYFIGGGIVVLGVVIFVGQNWKFLNDFTKIFATLGSAISLYMAAVLLNQHKHLTRVSEAFYFISALLAPLGIFITMDIAGMKVETAGSHSIASLIVFITFLASYLMDRKTTFLIFTIIFGTWFFFSFTTFLMGGRPFHDWDFVKYRWLASGITYLCLGYHYHSSDQRGISAWLYSSGIISFLTAAFVLGGWSSDKNVFWELAFPGLAFGAIFLSIYLRVKSFLVVGTIYLMIYIMKITGEYFSQGLGWPLALIVGGFSLMGIGYLAFYLNQKYIKSSH